MNTYFTVSSISTVEDPLAEDEPIDLFPVHLLPQTQSSIPIRCATPNDNEKTKHLKNGS